MSSSDSPSDALLELAEAALEDGYPEKTLELCRQIRNNAPADVNAWFLEAEALRELRASSAAEDAYRHAVLLDPAHSGAWCGLSTVLFDQRMYDQSRIAVHRALRLDAEVWNAYYTRALLRERRGDEDGARRDYLRAWRLGSPLGVPATLTDAEIRQVLVDAALRVDEALGAWVQALPLHVGELPDERACVAAHPFTSPAELVGHLAIGLDMVPDVEMQPIPPPPIVVYRRNLGRFAQDRDDLLAVVTDQIIEPVREWAELRAIEV
jgi:tetratricopeptide (TPR) repeat protein